MATNSNDLGKREARRPQQRNAPMAAKSHVTWQEAALAAGHHRIEMFLSPDGARALAAIKAFTNVSSETKVIERLIIAAARRLCQDATPTR